MADSTSSKKSKVVASAAPASKMSAGKASSSKEAVTAPKKVAVKPVAVKKAEPAAPKAAKVATAPKRASAAKKKPSEIGVEQRSHYIEVAAYFIAERRGFAPGDSLQDWVAAEAQVDQLLKEGKLGG